MNIKKRYFLYIFILFYNNDSICKKNIPQITIIKKKKVIPITIFIHGTHTRLFTNLFYKFIRLPDGLNKFSDVKDTIIYKSLLKTLINSDPKNFPIDSLYIFGWSGQLSHTARKEAAQTLYKSIKKITEPLEKNNIKYKITIVTHSHGGNVALNLADETIEKDPEFKIDKLIFLGIPVQEKTKNFVKDPIFNQVYNIYSSLDAIQRIDLQKFHQRSNKNIPLLSQRTFEANTNLKQTKIKINNRAIFHIEFILDNFLSALPQLLKELDKLDSSKSNYLIKINTKHNNFEILQGNKKQNKENASDQTPLDSLIIFVHGSHTTSKLFINYVQEINKLINIRDICKKYHSHLIAESYCRSLSEYNSFYTFGWSGEVSSKIRFEASKILYSEIQRLIEEKKLNNPKITIIAHSHGGNVILNLAKIIDENTMNFTIDKLILLACPVQVLTQHLVGSSIFKKVYNIYSSIDTMQVMDPQGFQKGTLGKNVPLFSKRRFDPYPNVRQGKIKINNRAIFHVEFLLENFMEVLQDITDLMEKINSQNKDLIKVQRKSVKEAEKFIKKETKITAMPQDNMTKTNFSTLSNPQS